MKIKGQKNQKTQVFPKIIFALLIIGVIGGIASGKKNQNTLPPEKESPAVSSVNMNFDTSGYIKMDAEVLFDFGEYMAGSSVVTVITVESANSTALKAKTANNDGFFFSINCEFDNNISSYQKGDLITVAGTVKESSTETVVLEHCTIIGTGEIQQELQENIESQRQQGESFKQDAEAREAEIELEEQNAYIAECITVSYSDVERNPDQYDDTKIVISGKVEQVSEGLFDSVTLRINCNGNMWYATYTRQKCESRIIEGDSVTAYGKCTGVTSYITVLGSQVTIPSIKIKYIVA